MKTLKYFLLISLTLLSSKFYAQETDSTLYNKGWVQIDSANYAKAIANFDKVIAINPKFARADNARGASKAALAKYTEALADFNKAIELDSTIYSFYYNKALTLCELEKFEDALSN